jgi:UTP--glucose-1-phosphate uridylyltransferase
VLFVTGRGKSSIEDHFDSDAELIRILRETGREELVAELAYERMGVDFLYTRQREQRGLADAVLCAERFSGDSPFVLALGDAIIGRRQRSTVVPALTAAFERFNAACAVAVVEVPADQTHRYGIVTPASDADVFAIEDLVEKPPADAAPSRLAVAARYVFSPAIFDAIRHTPADRHGEVLLTDSMRLLLARGVPVVGVRLPAGERRYDAGTVES